MLTFVQRDNNVDPKSRLPSFHESHFYCVSLPITDGITVTIDSLSSQNGKCQLCFLQTSLKGVNAVSLYTMCLLFNTEEEKELVKVYTSSMLSFDFSAQFSHSLELRVRDRESKSMNSGERRGKPNCAHSSTSRVRTNFSSL